jgi:hypothetical protein
MIDIAKLTEELPQNALFMSDSQDVKAIKTYVGEIANEFDAFFVVLGDGEYLAVYGIYGVIPYLTKTVTKILDNHVPNRYYPPNER